LNIASLNLYFASNDNTTLTSLDTPPSCVSTLAWIISRHDADCELALVSGEKSKYVLPSAAASSIPEYAVVLLAIQHKRLA
jgi:hypothetical protein